MDDLDAIMRYCPNVKSVSPETGNADFKAYIDKVLELGIEENCKKYGEACVAGIEMGEPGGTVDDPARWVKESLDYLARILPELKL